jgi:hypothetical protein
MLSSAIASAAFRAWISQPDIGWLLEIPTNDLWWYTGVPLVVCFIAVNLFFRHIITVIWFVTKLSIAGIVYIHIREIISTNTSENTMTIESNILNLEPGTLDAMSTTGARLTVSRAITFIASSYPYSFFDKNIPPPPPLPEAPLPQVDDTWLLWMDGMLTI